MPFVFGCERLEPRLFCTASKSTPLCSCTKASLLTMTAPSDLTSFAWLCTGVWAAWVWAVAWDQKGIDCSGPCTCSPGFTLDLHSTPSMQARLGHAPASGHLVRMHPRHRSGGLGLAAWLVQRPWTGSAQCRQGVSLIG